MRRYASGRTPLRSHCLPRVAGCRAVGTRGVHCGSAPWADSRSSPKARPNRDATTARRQWPGRLGRQEGITGISQTTEPELSSEFDSFGTKRPGPLCTLRGRIASASGWGGLAALQAVVCSVLRRALCTIWNNLSAPWGRRASEKDAAKESKSDLKDPTSAAVTAASGVRRVAKHNPL